MLEKLFENQLPVSVYSFRGDDPYVNLECVPYKMEEDGFLLFCNNESLIFDPVRIPFSVKCRLGQLNVSKSVRYYIFETALVQAWPAEGRKTVLKLNYPVNYYSSDRRLDRYIPGPTNIHTLSVWPKGNEAPDITMQNKPLLKYFMHENIKILNISSGGIRLSLSNAYLQEIGHEFSLLQGYIFKITLSYYDKPAEIFLTAVVRNIVPIQGMPQSSGHIEVGFQFIKEAFFNPGKKFAWNDIMDKGSWHIGSWIFSSNLAKCKGSSASD